MPHTSSPIGLVALQHRIQQDFEYLCLPSKAWLPALESQFPVLIIGGGMAGITLAAALKFQGIPSKILDAAAPKEEGPWRTTARMETLRSPKELTGPSLGLPNLTFRAWYEAQHGVEGWQSLGLIPRTVWADYLDWLKEVCGIAVENYQEVTNILPFATHVEVQVRHTQTNVLSTLTASRVVLATGREGLGDAYVPEWAHQLPQNFWAHSSDRWSAEDLKNKCIVVVGGGSSAMDAAATALENQATRVDLLIRRNDLPRINKGKGIGSPGMAHGFVNLPDVWKWRFRNYIHRSQVPPPHGSTLRVSRHANAFFHLGAAIHSVQVKNQQIELSTAKGTLLADFVIFCTGFQIDASLRPEIRSIYSHIRLWQDVFTPSVGQEDLQLARSPYLGSIYEFLPKNAQAPQGIERIHCFNHAATLSHGATSSDIPQISDGAQRLARGLASVFLQEHVDTFYNKLEQYDDPELHGDEWKPAPPLGEVQ